GPATPSRRGTGHYGRCGRRGATCSAVVRDNERRADEFQDFVTGGRYTHRCSPRFGKGPGASTASTHPKGKDLDRARRVSRVFCLPALSGMPAFHDILDIPSDFFVVATPWQTAGSGDGPKCPPCPPGAFSPVSGHARRYSLECRDLRFDTRV